MSTGLTPIAEMAKSDSLMDFVRAGQHLVGFDQESRHPNPIRNFMTETSANALMALAAFKGVGPLAAAIGGKEAIKKVMGLSFDYSPGGYLTNRYFNERAAKAESGAPTIDVTPEPQAPVLPVQRPVFKARRPN